MILLFCLLGSTVADEKSVSLILFLYEFLSLPDFYDFFFLNPQSSEIF